MGTVIETGSPGVPVTVASPASDIAVAVMTVEAGNSLPEMVSRGILNVSVALSSPSGNALERRSVTAAGLSEDASAFSILKFRA